MTDEDDSQTKGRDGSPNRPAGESQSHPKISHHPRPKERRISETPEGERKGKEHAETHEDSAAIIPGGESFDGALALAGIFHLIRAR